MSRIVKTDWIEVPADCGSMGVHVATPDQAGPFPAIVCFPSFLGVTEFRLELVRRMASEGYVVVLPDLFHRLGRRVGFTSPAQEDEAATAAGTLGFFDMVSDSRLAINVARAHPDVDGDRIGAVGYGMGGTVTFLAASAHRDLRAAAIFYSRNLLANASSAHRPVSPFLLAETIKCPVLFVSGAADPMPSVDDVQVLAAHFRRHGKSFEHRHCDAGHAFMEADMPAMHDEAASAWGWEVQTEYFNRMLGAR
ncbi:MAG: dienelactone hydrolase family protein [Lautropia sp.]